MTAWFLTWLWQGTALALVVSTTLRHLPRVNAATRYLVWWGALFALIWLGLSSSPHSVLPAAATLQREPASSPTFALYVRPLPQWSVTLIVGLWLTVALFKLLRILSGLHGLFRLKDSCLPMLRSLEEQLPLWQEAKRHGRPVHLVFCNELSSAAVLGLHQPCIAFPRLLLEVVSADELDQIVLHEYGHVQRRDDWTRLGQALLEAALWIHPAAVWIGRELNLEREVACDDWVVSRTGAPQAYADCLSRVAENRRCPVAPVFAPALFGGKGALLRRVDRLLDARRNARRELSLLTALAGLCLLGTAAVHLSAYSVLVERAVAPTQISTVGTEPGRAIDTSPSSVAEQVTVSARVSTTVRSGRGTVTSTETRERRRTGVPTHLHSPALPAELAPGPAPATLEPPTDAVPIVEGRLFHLVPPVMASSDNLPAREGAKGWQLAGAAGVNIGKATSKAAVGVASTLSRAGISLARSF